MRKITSEDAQRIIESACSQWKKKLARLWAEKIVLKEEIEISPDFYTEMRNACTQDQHQLFDEIFVRRLDLKQGDLVWICKEWGSAHEVKENEYCVKANGGYIAKVESAGKNILILEGISLAVDMDRPIRKATLEESYLFDNFGWEEGKLYWVADFWESGCHYLRFSTKDRGTFYTPQGGVMQWKTYKKCTTIPEEIPTSWEKFKARLGL